MARRKLFCTFLFLQFLPQNGQCIMSFVRMLLSPNQYQKVKVTVWYQFSLDFPSMVFSEYLVRCEWTWLKQFELCKSAMQKIKWTWEFVVFFWIFKLTFRLCFYITLLQIQIWFELWLFPSIHIVCVYTWKEYNFE